VGEALVQRSASRTRAVVSAAIAFLLSRHGVLWVVGTLAVLAAVSLSGDLGLLALLADRELLVLVVETAAVYGVYAWRNGALAAAWTMSTRPLWLWAARLHLCATRWSL
jgi:hypothetical protein